MLTGITVDSQRVSIPVEMLGDGEGMAVLTLARGAYLIMRSDLLATYPRQRLVEFSRMAQTLERLLPGVNGSFTPRKRRALQELHQQGYPVSDGSEYGLRAMVKPGISLEQVWEELSTLEGSLSHEVLAEREER
ncbi:MAG: hypothetical protein FJ011_05335 [Chloroflexi bacterium]|nr:hypothetical protein [Chloroflexota bacterium]